jgi:uncharacterized protein with PIN domain
VAHKDERTKESGELPILNLIPVEFAEIGQKRVEAMMNLQQELFGRFAEFTQAWFARAKSEADLASEFVTKLTAARSVPETATACQECMDKRMEMLAEDSRRLFNDSQKFLHMGTRLLMNGSAGNGSQP